MNRRDWLKILTATGIGTATFHKAAAIFAAQENELTKESLKNAAWVTDFELSDDDADSILKNVRRTNSGLGKLREVQLDPFLPPAFQFKPRTVRVSVQNPSRDIEFAINSKLKLPETDEAIAFCPVHELSHFIRTKQITSRRLTEIYLTRLKKYGGMLRNVVNLTEELALKQAEQADKEISEGTIKSPLHGIPWGAKDLIDVEGYPTTWGIPVHKERMPDESATVYKRLEDAGAVLVAKLSLGAIAMGDQWFGGKTRNPWNPKTGSSGSSAGSASATSAGLVGFSLGSETLGSITTPSKICGATGFRPTFGRVSRHGCMPLSWTMDKVGPICRSALDCGLVFAAIHGADGKDLMTDNVEFSWPKTIDFKGIKIGYSKTRNDKESRELKLLKELGCELIEVSLPATFPLYSLAEIISVEAASVFDELLRDGKTEGWNSWTNTFRAAQFVSAIDYLRMMRLRTRLMQEMEEFLREVDFLFNTFDVFHTNLTGHPSIVMPFDFKELESEGKRPLPVTITGGLDDDARLLAFAEKYQAAIGSLQRPELDSWLAKFDNGELDGKPEK